MSRRLSLIALLLGACVTHGAKCPTSPADVGGEHPAATPDALTGTWVNQDTHAYLTVAVAGGEVLTVFAIDDDGEVWPVSDASFDPKSATLHFTAHVPSTGYVLVSTLKLRDPDALVGSHTGTRAGDDVWTRYVPPR